MLGVDSGEPLTCLMGWYAFVKIWNRLKTVKIERLIDID
jgi:hypothetical protein